MTSSTKSSGGKLLGISGNEETGTAVPTTGKKTYEVFFLLSNFGISQTVVKAMMMKNNL
jgi:hypothetical protein